MFYLKSIFASRQCHTRDGTIFPPISSLLRQYGRSYDELVNLVSEAEQEDYRKPAHALLPDDEAEEIPVHHTDR